jgi:Protein of unknown function (DUF1674)
MSQPVKPTSRPRPKSDYVPPPSPPVPQPDPLPAADAPEIGGRNGPDPVRYGDWEKSGIAVDF